MTFCNVPAGFEVYERLLEILNNFFQFIACLGSDMLTAVGAFVSELGNAAAAVRTCLSALLSHCCVYLLIGFLLLGVDVEVDFVDIQAEFFGLAQQHLTLFTCNDTVG